MVKVTVVRDGALGLQGVTGSFPGGAVGGAVDTRGRGISFGLLFSFDFQVYDVTADAAVVFEAPVDHSRG